MAVQFKPTPVSRDETAYMASLAFVLLAQEGHIDDATIVEHPSAFQTWLPYWTGKAKTIIMENGRLYQAKKDIKEDSSELPPSENPKLWRALPMDWPPVWSAPIGSSDGYAIGAIVKFDDATWISTTNNNYCQPGIHGWKEHTENAN